MYIINIMNENLDSKIFVKNNILYLDTGYFRIGDLEKIKFEFKKIIPQLQKPFQAIVTFERTIKKDSLIHPDEKEIVKILFDFVSKAGRDLTIWVIPMSSILYNELLQIVKANPHLKISETIEQAEQIIIDHRSLNLK